MNRRKLAIQVIIAEVAEAGEAGKCSVRAYVETRMSLATFNKAIATGYRIYEKGQRGLKPFEKESPDTILNSTKALYLGG